MPEAAAVERLINGLRTQPGADSTLLEHGIALAIVVSGGVAGVAGPVLLMIGLTRVSGVVARCC